MPIGRAKLCTLADLASAGFTVTDPVDAAEKIIAASEHLQKTLGMIFTPQSEEVNCRGGKNYLEHPSSYPFLEVNSILYQNSGIEYDEENVIVEKWAIKQRYGRKFIHDMTIDGTFGYLDNINKTQTNNASELTRESDEMELDSVNNFMIGDIVDITDGDESYRIIVNAIDRENKTISFDAITDFGEEIAIGSSITRWGTIPYMIRRATILLYKKLNTAIGSSDYEDEQLQGRIKTEKTDNYSYTLFTNQETHGSGGKPYLTGDEMVDNALLNYLPVHMGDVV